MARTAPDPASLAANWWAIVLRGLAAIAFGILTFIVPGMSITVLVLMFGGYAVVEGVFNVVAAGRRRSENALWWVLLVEGLASIAAGIFAFVAPRWTALVLLYVIASWAVITGALEIAAAIRLRKEIAGEWWLALSGVLSIGFGGLLMLLPGAGALALALWIGVYSVIFGALLVGLGLRLRRFAAGRERVPISRAA